MKKILHFCYRMLGNFHVGTKALNVDHWISRAPFCATVRALRINPQYVVLFHHFRHFLKEASEKKIDVAPLKGAHLLTAVYGNDKDRDMLADVDFLVRPSEWDPVTKLLLNMGFERRDIDN